MILLKTSSLSGSLFTLPWFASAYLLSNGGAFAQFQSDDSAVLSLQLRQPLEQPPYMADLDHGCPVPVTEPFTPHAVREHRLDLDESRPAYQRRVLEHSTCFSRHAVEIHPAVLTRHLEELGHEIFVIGPRHDLRTICVVIVQSAQPLRNFAGALGQIPITFNKPSASPSRPRPVIPDRFPAYGISSYTQNPGPPAKLSLNSPLTPSM